MNSEASHEWDWVHLPAGVEPESLWDSLHDAYVVDCHSDPWARTVVVEFRSSHLQAHYHLPEDWTFHFRFEQVAAVRAQTYPALEHPELAAARHAGRELSREEEYRLAAEASDRRRLESVSWSAVEGPIAAQETELALLDADLVRQGDGAVTLRLAGMLHGSDRYVLFIRGGALCISGSDGKELNVEELIEMGAAYWEAFDRRRPAD